MAVETDGQRLMAEVEQCRGLFAEVTHGEDAAFVKSVRQELTKLSSKVANHHPKDQELTDVLVQVEQLLDKARQLLFDVE